MSKEQIIANRYTQIALKQLIHNALLLQELKTSIYIASIHEAYQAYKLLRDFGFTTFVHPYGENSCYLEVIIPQETTNQTLQKIIRLKQKLEQKYANFLQNELNRAFIKKTKDLKRKKTKQLSLHNEHATKLSAKLNNNGPNDESSEISEDAEYTMNLKMTKNSQ